MNDNNESNSLLDMFGTSEKETPQQATNVSQQSTSETQETIIDTPVETPQQSIIDTPIETPQPVNNTVIETSNNVNQTIRPEENPLENENMITTKVEIEEKVTNPEEKLLDIFTGNKLYVFANGGFSWGTFFVPAIYLIYRKFYGKGAFFLIFNALIIFATYINSILLMGVVELVYFVVSVIYATKFKRQYFEYCKKKVSEIMASTNDYNEQKKRCMQEGGVDPKAFVVLALIGVLSYSVMGYTAGNQDTANIEKEFGLNIVFPDEFKNIDRPYSETKYQEEGNYYVEGLAKISNDTDMCTFAITKSTAKHLEDGKSMQSIGLEYIKKTYPLLTELKAETHNDIEYQMYYDENKKIYYYFYADNESMTLIKVDIDKETDNLCTNYKNYILDNTTK